MINFIDDHRGSHGVEPICRVPPITPSTYHDHVAKRADPEKLSARAKRDEVLKPEIARVFAGNFEVYGARKSLPPRTRGSGASSGAKASILPAARWSG